jgi:hypothetical protein
VLKLIDYFDDFPSPRLHENHFVVNNRIPICSRHPERLRVYAARAPQAAKRTNLLALLPRQSSCASCFSWDEFHSQSAITFARMWFLRVSHKGVMSRKGYVANVGASIPICGEPTRPPSSKSTQFDFAGTERSISAKHRGNRPTK